ncbi:MAG: ankyrin repeat domain-containing protein [Sedimentisphaerales bacterium]|nr:ankyrin repeat domain-containing protein [Sedimentisphaerales bacterium]
MEPWLIRIADYLLAQSWQIAVLTIGVALATFALRNRSAHVRYLLWLIVLAKALVPPLYSIPIAVLPHRAVPAYVPAPPTAEKTVAESDSRGEGVPPLRVEGIPPSTRSASSPDVLIKPTRYGTRAWLAIGWLAGAIALALYYLGNALRTQIWLQRRRCALPGESARDIESFFMAYGVRHLPRIWLMKRINQPFVWGLVRGSIYLPARLLDDKHAKFQPSLLGHELSHVIRLDAMINSLQVVAQTLFWFHPFVWWANAKIRGEREKCCDEMTIARLNAPPEEYGEAIVETLAAKYEQARPVPSLAVAGQIKNIEERIRTMLKPGKKFYKRPSVVVAMTMLALALITIPTALVLTVRAAAEIDIEPPHGAAFGGNITAVEQWLAQGGDVNVKNAAGETLLRRALLEERLDIIQLLEKHGADINAEIRNDPSLIRQVATNGSPAVADYLISRGADTSHVYVASYLGKLDQVKEYIESGSQQVSATDKNQILMGAITGGHADIIEYILDHGADIKTWDILNRAVGANRKHILELLIDQGADPNPGGGWSPLHITIWNYPRLEIAEALLSHGADPFKGEWNPMHYAIESEKKDMVKLFLDHSRDKNLPPYVYHVMAENHKDVLPLFEPYVKISPIHLSCFYGKLDDVKSYLEQGKDIDAQDIGDLSLLQFAVVGCQMEIADYLIAKGCNINSKASDGATALHLAANGNDKGEEMAQRLITASALVEAKDNDNCTPFFYSVSGVSSDLGAAQVLLEHGANINIQRKGDGATALHDAAQRGSMKRMRWLIARGADVNRRKEDGSTPLSVAMNRDRLDAVKYLLEHGADINYHNEDGKTPLHFAAYMGRKEIVEMLLKNGANITVQDSVGRTATGLAKEKGYTEIVELLNSRTRQLDQKKEIMTIFDYAAIGDTEKIKSLIEAGQDVSTKSKNGGIALIWASLRGHREIAELLIQNGANVNFQDHSGSGWTPLLLACRYGKKEIVELLLANGAEINAKNNAGSTALDIASQGKHTEIVELLQKHGAKE